MNSPEYYLLITSRGWTPGQYAATVRDVWIRTLLRHPLPGRATEGSASSPWLLVSD